MNSILPQYSTVLFTDVWDDEEKFEEDLAASPFAAELTEVNAELVFYLLYARYGNNPIANRDINQWKFKIFSVMFQYGPTWAKRLDIQKKLRAIQDEDLRIGSKAIYNAALNPSTEPTTNTLDELDYINEQRTTNYKKSKMDAYVQLLDLLDTDVTEEFITKFRKCFKVFVAPENPLVFVTEEDELEIDEGD